MNAVADRFSVPPARKIAWLAVGGFVPAIAGAVAALCVSWVGGIVTRAELDAEVAALAPKSAVDAMRRETGDSLKAIADSLKTEELARRSDREMLVVEMRRRVGLQAMVSYTADPKRRANGERIAAAVRARFDDLVQRGEQPTLAAEKALEAALLEKR